MYGKNHPSDIDMFYIGKNNTLVIGEIKNECGKLMDGQRHLLERLINGWTYDGICLFITHNKYVQNGDKKVDVPSCYVKEYYLKNKTSWSKPKSDITVKEVLELYWDETQDDKSNRYNKTG